MSWATIYEYNVILRFVFHRVGDQTCTLNLVCTPCARMAGFSPPNAST